LALLLLSSCLFPDLSSLSEDDAGGGDATADVTNDVAKDGTPATDATLDGGPTDAGLDVKTSPCAVQHTFCDDFDDGSLGSRWDKTENGGGGTLSQSTTAVTPPYSFQAQVPGGSNHPYALLQKFLTASQHIHYECDIMIIGSQTTNFEIDYYDLAFVPTGFTYGNFNLERLNSGGTSEEIATADGADADTFNDDNISEEFTSWKHLVADVDYTKSTFTVTVDGATIDAMSMKPPLASAPSTLGVGLTYSAGLTATWTILIDNVVIDVQ
jgi:hypothetical protein